MSSENARLVVVDDDVALRTAFAKALTRAGFEVSTACGSNDVVGLVEVQAPAAVLMDNHMPGVNGLDLITLLREQWTLESLPILLISGSSSLSEIEAALRAGANDFRRKPVELPDLLDAVRALVAESGATTSEDGTP